MVLLLRLWLSQATEPSRRTRSHSARAAAALLFLALLAPGAPLWAANSGGTTETLPSFEFAQIGRAHV